MVCSMVKKGLIGAALGAGALFLVFGTHAPSYVKTAYHKVNAERQGRGSAAVRHRPGAGRDRQPRTGDPRQHREAGAGRGRRRAPRQGNRRHPDQHGRREEGPADACGRASRRASTGWPATARVAYTEDEVKADLARRYDAYNNVKEILEAKESTLKAKQSEIVAFRKQLETMMAQKKKLTTKLDKIEAKLQPDRGHPGHQRVPALTAAPCLVPRRRSPTWRSGSRSWQKSAEIEARYVETGVPVIVKPDSRCGQGDRHRVRSADPGDRFPRPGQEPLIQSVTESRDRPKR